MNMTYDQDKIKTIVALECADFECESIFNTREYEFQYKEDDISNIILYDNGELSNKKYYFEENKLTKLDHGGRYPYYYFDLFFYDDNGYEKRREIYRNNELTQVYIPIYENGNFKSSKTYIPHPEFGSDSVYYLSRESFATHDDKPNPLKVCLPLYDIYGSYAFIMSENNMLHHEEFFYSLEGELEQIGGANYLHEFNEQGYPTYTYYVNAYDDIVEMYYTYKCY